MYVHGAEIVWDLLLIRCERLVRELRVDRGELTLLGDILVEMRIDAGQECVGGCPPSARSWIVSSGTVATAVSQNSGSWSGRNPVWLE